MTIIPRFRTPLIFEDDGGLPFVLHDPLVYVSAVYGGTLTIPAGFKTDLASIPRGLWNVLPQVGRYDAAAVVHDYLYQMPLGVDRSEADAILLEAMGVLKVGWWTRTVIYSAVRVGGGKIWANYRAQEAK
jgi:hypothetical protein